MSRLTGNERAIVVTALKHAAPYIRMFKRKVFVIKAGGEAFQSAATTRSIVEQVGILHEVGIRIVLVHGGGPQSTQLAKERGIPIQFVDGRRVTDESTLEVPATVLNDQINPMIVAAFGDLDIPAVGIRGRDASVIRAHRRPPIAREGHDGETVDYGYVGDIDAIDADILAEHLNDGLIPIISPMAADGDGTLLNIRVASVVSWCRASRGIGGRCRKTDSRDLGARHTRVPRESGISDFLYRHSRSRQTSRRRPNR